MNESIAMVGGSRAAVIIPTTSGPVSIVSLIEEAPEVGRSVVCINMTTDQAGIASGYNDFVKRPTGVVHRLFGKAPYPVYRLDVSDRIEAGSSWQLAMLIAHALRADGNRLDESAGATSDLVWATGTVSSLGYSVGAVAHVADKLRNSRPLFESALRAGRRVHIFIPKDNQPDVDPDIAEWLRQHRLEVKAISSADEVFQHLSLPPIPQAASKPAEPEAAWSGNPYRGLEPFLREHRPVFFGRARAREEALEQLRTAAARGRPFLLVHGQSGVGKSSLVQAGLVGDIEERAREGGRFRSVVVTPSSGGANPVASLRVGLASILDEPAGSLTESIAGLTEQVGNLLERAVQRSKADKLRQTGLLVIDQLEELFDPSIPEEAAAAFGDVVDRIVRTGAVWIVATIRSDALGSIDKVPALARLAKDERVYRLDRPSRLELSEIIVAPATAVGLSFPDRSVPEELADIAARSPDSLPLLQALLYRFFDQADDKGQLTAQGLKRIGGFEGAVGQWAEQVHSEILRMGVPPEVVDRVLVSLVRLDPETKRALARTIQYDPRTEEGRVLEQLVESRLVSLHEAPQGPRVRLAHEALTTHWSHLDALFNRLTAAITLRDDLEARAHNWLRDPTDLLHGPAMLEAAQNFVREELVSFTPVVADYVKASVKEAEAQKQSAERLVAAELESKRLKEAALQRRIQLQRRFMGLAAVVTIVLGALLYVSYRALYWAEVQRNDALIAQSRFLARDARQATASGDATLGANLAFAALPQTIASPDRPLIRDAETALAHALYNRRELLVFRGHQLGTASVRHAQGHSTVSAGGVYSAAFSPDGARVVTASSDGTDRVWNATTGVEIGRFKGPPGEIIGAVFSPDGKTVLASPGRWLAAIWEPDAGKHITLENNQCATGGPDAIYLGPVPSGVGNFSPDNARAVTAAYRSREACLWDTKAFKLIAPLRGEGEITSVEFSPDGERLLVLAKGRPPMLRNGRTGEQIAELGEPGDKLCTATFSPDSASLSGPCADSVARVWEAQTGKELLVVRGHEEPLTAAVFSPDSSILATASRDKTVRLWDSKTGAPTKAQRAILTHLRPIASVAFSVNGQYLLTISSTGTAEVWDLKRDSRVGLGGHEGEIMSARFSPDSTRVITASRDRTARLWNLRGEQIAVFRGHNDEVVSASFSPDGNRVVTASHDGTARIWDATVSGPLASLALAGHRERDIRSLRFSNDGKYILSAASYDKIVRLWDVGSRTTVATYQHNADVANAVFSPDGKHVATSTDDNSVHIWETASGNLITTLRGADGAAASSVVWSPDAKYLVIIPTDFTSEVLGKSDENGDGKFDLWNVHTGKSVRTFDGHTGRITSASFGPDGTKLATGSWDKTVRIWDVPSGELYKLLDSPMRIVTEVKFFAEGRKLAIGSHDGMARIWDAQSGVVVEVKHTDRADWISVYLSSDGTRIATQARLSRSGRLFDTATGSQIGPLSEGVVYFSSDGTRIVVNNGNAYSLWDATTGRHLANLQTRYANAGLPALSPDGTFVVMPNQTNRDVYLWDGKFGSLLAVIPTPELAGWTSAFSPDGKLFAVGFTNGTIRLWGTPVRCQAMLDLGRTGIARDLSSEERARYFLQEGAQDPKPQWYDALRPFLAWALPAAAGACP